MKNDLYRTKPNASGANTSVGFGRAGTPKDVPYVGIAIRKATAEDLGTLLDIHKAHVTEEHKFNPLLNHGFCQTREGQKYVLDFINQGNVFVAVDASAGIVGYLSVEEGRLDPNESIPSAILNSIFVRPDYRRQGIGRQLLKESIPLVTKNSSRSLAVRVYEANEPAKQFWKSHGFSSHQVILRKDGATANASGANTAVGFCRAGTPKDVKDRKG